VNKQVKQVTTSIMTPISTNTSIYKLASHHLKESNNNSGTHALPNAHICNWEHSLYKWVNKQVNKQLLHNLLILSPQLISRPCGRSHDWVRQTPRSFKTTVLDISQIISIPRGGSHDWVRQTPRAYACQVSQAPGTGWCSTHHQASPLEPQNQKSYLESNS
jgi:hypothetical protein